MKLLKTKGSKSNILEVFIQDSSSTTGVGLTGLTSASSGLSCYYHRNTASAAVQVSLVSMTLGQFTSGGFKEVDASNLPGVYQVCIPDAAFLDGADSISAVLKGATNMAPVPLEIQLMNVGFDPTTSYVDEVRTLLRSLNVSLIEHMDKKMKITKIDFTEILKSISEIEKKIQTDIASIERPDILGVEKSVSLLRSKLDEMERQIVKAYHEKNERDYSANLSAIEKRITTLTNEFKTVIADVKYQIEGSRNQLTLSSKESKALSAEVVQKLASVIRSTQDELRLSIDRASKSISIPDHKEDFAKLNDKVAEAFDFMKKDIKTIDDAQKMLLSLEKVYASIMNILIEFTPEKAAQNMRRQKMMDETKNILMALGGR